MKDRSPWNRLRLEQGKSAKRREQQRHCVMNWPQPLFSPLLSGDSGTKSKVRPGKNEVGREGRFSFALFLTIKLLFLIGSKLIFPTLSLVFPWQSLVSHHSVLTLTYKIFHLIFSPSLSEEGKLGGHLAASQGLSITPVLVAKVIFNFFFRNFIYEDVLEEFRNLRTLKILTGFNLWTVILTNPFKLQKLYEDVYQNNGYLNIWKLC